MAFKYYDAGITNCILKYKNCTGKMFVGLAHSLRRRFIYTEEEYCEVIPVCSNCHAKLDGLFERDEGGYNNHEETREIVLNKLKELKDYLN